MNIFAKAISTNDLQAARLADIETKSAGDLNNTDWCRAWSLVDFWNKDEMFLPLVRYGTYGASAVGRTNSSAGSLSYCHSGINNNLGSLKKITIPFLYIVFQDGYKGCELVYGESLHDVLNKLKKNMTEGQKGQISYKHLLKFYKWFVGRNNPLMTQLKKVADVDFHLAGDVPVGFSYDAKRVSQSLGGQLHSLSRCLVDYYDKSIYNSRTKEFTKAVDAGLSTKAAIAWAEYKAFGHDYDDPDDVDDPIWMDFDSSTFYAWMTDNRDTHSDEYYTDSFKDRGGKECLPQSLAEWKDQLTEWKMK